MLVLDNDYSNGISFWIAALSTVPFLADTSASCFWRYCVCAKLWSVRKLLASLVMSCSFLAHAPDYCIKFPFILPSSHWGFIKTQSVMFSCQGALQLTPSVSLSAWFLLYSVLTANIPRRAAPAFPGVLRCAWYSSEIINLTLQGSGFWYGPAI